MENKVQSPMWRQICNHAQARPKQIALAEWIGNGRVKHLTYPEWKQQIEEKAGLFSKIYGIKENDICIIAWGGMLTEYLTILMALDYLGAIAVPVKADVIFRNPDYYQAVERSSHAKWLIRTDGIQSILVSGEYINKDNVRIVLYTSGSTGEPKGVPLTEKGIAAMCQQYAVENHRDENSITLSTLGLHHVFGLITLVYTGLWAGGQVVLVSNESFVQNPGLWQQMVEKYRVTHSGAPNYMLSMLTKVITPDAGALTSITSMIVSTEMVQNDTLQNFLMQVQKAGMSSEAMTASYGLTETTGLVTISAFGKGMQRYGDVYSVGQPLAGYDVRIDTPRNGIGELTVSGPSVLTGYWGEDKEERHDFIEIDGKNYFRTGDLGFCIDNEIYLYGRKKEILIIRGENYSPYLIEETARLQSDKRMREVVAVSVPGEDTEQVILFVESEDTLNGKEKQTVCNSMSRRLMSRFGLLPQTIVFSDINTIPRTGSGKIRRLELAEKYVQGNWNGEEYYYTHEVREGTLEATEFLMKRISYYTEREVTKEQTDKSLTELGMSSLLLQILMAEINETYQICLPTDVWKNYFTIARLAEYIYVLIAEQKQNQEAGERAAETDSTAGVYALNEVQQAYLTGRNPEMEWGGISCQYYMEREMKHFDPDRFIKALSCVVERQSALRTVICADFTQQVMDEIELPVEIFYLDESEAANTEALRRELQNEVLPLGGPMFKVVLKQLDKEEQDWRIHVLIDMLCADAMSLFLFWKDCQKAYETGSLETLPGNWQEFQNLQKDKNKAVREDEEYWNNRIVDFPQAPQLPWNLKAEKRSKDAFVRYSYYLKPECWQKFQNIARELGITPTEAFLTLFAELLSAYGAGDRFTLSLAIQGRKPTESKIFDRMGDFTKVLLFAVTRRDVSVIENAKRIQCELKEDLLHANYSSFELNRKLKQEHGTYQMYPVVFTSLLDMERLLGMESPFSVNRYSQSMTPQVVLDHQLLPADGGVILCWDAIEAAFTPGVLENMFSAYVNLVEQAMESGFWNRTLREIRTKKDREEQEWANRTNQDIPPKTLIEDFYKIVKQQPKRRAIRFKERDYSYAQLKHRADQVSQMLKEAGIEIGDRVMIQMEKSFDLIAAIVGTVQIGAVYLPMPHDQPAKRQLAIYEKAEAKGIIVERETNIATEIPYFIMADADALEGIWKEQEIETKQLAYVIYTSGSTGKPKGVAITHGAAMNTIQAVNSYLKLSKEDCLIGLSSVNFDLSVYDIFGALSAGASLLVPTEAERIDPARWMSLCKEAGVTVWNTVPALMDILLEYCITTSRVPANLGIREVILSGDWIPMDLFGKMQKVLPQARLTSMGGATEASIWSNYFPVREIKSEWVSIPYGYPLPNQIFHVLDTFGRFCPAEVSGRLYIGGAGLAAEYYREEELTRNAFIKHPDTGERLYDTGDYGRYTKDGCLIFMGRKDAQIKINGYRIELGEIQSAVDKSGYPENVVLLLDEGEKGKKLVVYVKTIKAFDEREVKKRLENYVPGYFIPERILPTAEIPVTANGKIDKKKLESWYWQRVNERDEIKEEELSEEDRKVLEVLRAGLELPNLSAEEELSSLGVTSLALIQLANRLENELGYRPKVNDIIQYRSVEDFLSYYRNTKLADIQKEQEMQLLKRREEEAKLERDDPWFHHPIIEMMREELNVNKICPEDVLNNLGLSSLSVIRIANKLESKYGCRPSIHEMLRYQTVGDLIAFYEQKQLKGEMEGCESTVPMEETVPDNVLECLESILNMRGLKPEDSFSTLGVSSLEMIRIANKLEGWYGHRPSIQDMAKQQSLQELIDYYEELGATIQTDSEENKHQRKVVELYNRCKDVDIVIWPEGDKIRFKAPAGALTPELKEELSREKESLLEYLQERDTITGEDLTPLQMAYVLGRQNQYVLGDVTAHYYVEYAADDLDLRQLEDAVNELIIRNEILRTIITPEGRMKVYQTNPGYHVEVVPEGERDLRSEMKAHQFVLGTWPMFDVKVTQCKKCGYRIHIGMDCLILDGWSINMFMHQFAAAYAKRPLHVTNYTFRGYLEEERRWLKDKQYYREAQEYWEEQIKKLPPAPHINLKQPLDEIKNPTFSRMQFTLSPENTFALFRRFQDYELTPSLALCTAYMHSLSKWSVNKDVTLNLTMFNRQPIHPDVQEVLGDFTNIALVGYHREEGKNFIEMTQPVKEELWNAIEYRSYNVIHLLGQLVERHKDLIAAPYVFTSLIDKESEESEDVLDEIGFREIFAQTQTPQVVLDHQLYLKRGRLVLVLDYVQEAFEKEILSAMFKDYTDRIERLARNEDWEAIYE